jgi:hypothetical protein
MSESEKMLSTENRFASYRFWLPFDQVHKSGQVSEEDDTRLPPLV